MGPMLVVRVGFELLVAIFLGALTGFWLDRETGRIFFPFFSLLGFLLGSSGGMLLVYRTMMFSGAGHSEKKSEKSFSGDKPEKESGNSTDKDGKPL